MLSQSGVTEIFLCEMKIDIFFDFHKKRIGADLFFIIEMKHLVCDHRGTGTLTKIYLCTY